MVYEPTQKDSAPSFQEIKAFIASGVEHWITEGLGYRVLRAPWDLHHPVWVEDNNFCLDNHIHHIALPAPGRKEQLCEFISYIMSMPLDPNRPLWDSWIVEGLEGGRIAWVCKVHHVLADGLMSADHIINIHSHNEKPDDKNRLKASDYVFKTFPEPPGKVRLAIEALKDLAKSYTIEFPGFYRDYKSALKARNKVKKTEPVIPAYQAFMAPFTMINKPGSHYFKYRYETFSLGDFKALSRSLNCTINDLVLTICSEALRRYIREYEPLPDKPMVAIMPVSSRKDNRGSKFLNSEIQNNSVSLAYVPLDVNIESFKERLYSIKQGSRGAMEEIRRTKGLRMENFADYMPGSFFRILNWVLASRQKKKKGPVANMAISNVPGPRETLYACNGKLQMTELLSCGNLTDVTSLGVTVWSYADNLVFSCFFRNSVMPNPRRFTQHLHDSYTEALAAYGSKTGADITPIKSA
jgi:diacylglycerol O-acyltransferase